MREICIPGTSLWTSRLGLGTASMHHILDGSERRRVLAAATDAGYTHFDTARMYGEGMAERTLGRFLAGGLRQRVTLATKFGLPANPLFERLPVLMYGQRALGSLARRTGARFGKGRPRQLSLAAAEASIADSLKALRTDWLDILFVHEPQISEAAQLQDLVEWLSRQKSSGRVRYVGLAGNAVDCAALARQFDGAFDILQVEDSLAGLEADALLAAGLPLQVTFGYMRQSIESGLPSSDGLAVIGRALRRNQNGMVLVSTRKIHRLQEAAALPDEQGVW